MAVAATERIPVDELVAQAQQVRFARTIATVIAGVFFAIGWTFGRLWLCGVFCAVSVRYGWRQGTGAVVAPPQSGVPS